MKVVYKIDENGYYVGDHVCQTCAKTGEYLYPNLYTEKEPPAQKEYHKIRFNGNEWVYEPNYKNVAIYPVDDANALPKDCPTDELPSGFTTIAPPSFEKDYIQNNYHFNEKKQKWVEKYSREDEEYRILLLNSVTNKILSEYEMIYKQTDNDYLMYQKRKETGIVTNEDKLKYESSIKMYKDATLHKRKILDSLQTLSVDELESLADTTKPLL